MSDLFNLQVLNGLPNQGRLVDENASVRNLGALVRKLDGAMDQFGAVRVTEYQPIFSTQPLAVSTIGDRPFTTGSATIQIDNGEYRLNNPGGETCRLETGQRGRYQAGLVGVPGIGVRRTTAPTGTTTYRYGYYSSMDGAGFGFKEDVDGLHVFVRRNGVEIYSKPRSEWIDPLDGTGPSGRSINFLDGHVHRMPFIWYGYGTIEFGVMVPNTPEQSDEVTTIDRWSPDEAMSFANPNLPVTAEVEGDSPGELYVGGRQYGVYGQFNLQRRIMGEVRTGQSIAEADGLVPLISARVRGEAPWRSIPIQVEGVSIEADTSLDFLIILGATLNQETWALSQFTNGETSTEFELTATSFTGGEIVAGPAFIRAGSGGNAAATTINFPEQDIPVGEPVTVVARSQGGSGTVRTALRIAELR